MAFGNIILHFNYFPLVLFKGHKEYLIKQQRGIDTRMEVPPGGGGQRAKRAGGVGDGTEKGSRAGDCPAREP